MKKELVETDIASANEFFECKICNNFLLNPVECGACRQSFCKTCVDQYT